MWLEQRKPTVRRSILEEVVREVNGDQNLQVLAGQSKALGFILSDIGSHWEGIH